MKAALNLPHDADLTTIPDAYRPKLAFELRAGKMVAHYPKGTEFEGDHALALIQNGQACPIDEEAAKACGMSPEQLQGKQREYLAAVKGIKGKKDMEMFLAGAIEGYEPGTSTYIKGPQWDAWQAAESAATAAITADVI